MISVSYTHLVETVEFYPPDGLNSVELAFAYRGYASSKDVVSMIVDLAQKGYIEIHQGPNKKDFTLIKRLESVSYTHLDVYKRQIDILSISRYN